MTDQIEAVVLDTVIAEVQGQLDAARDQATSLGYMRGDAVRMVADWDRQITNQEAVIANRENVLTQLLALRDTLEGVNLAAR